MGEEMLADLRDREAELFLVDLLEAAKSSSQLSLDLKPVKRITRFAGALMANVLLGRLGEVRLNVSLPDETYRLGMLARSGLLFGLANHPHVTLDEAGALPSEMATWKQNWVPGSAPTPLYWTASRQVRDQLSLFQPADLGEGEYPNVFGPYSAAFINAHLAALGSVRDELSNRVIWPWLTRLIPTIQNQDKASEEVKQFVRDVGSLVDELLENVAEHASYQLEGRRRRPSSSLVQVSLTRGGRASFDRLYITVQDTGPGIERTARPKLEPHARNDLAAVDLIHGLFEGSIDSWPDRRGRGLPRVLHIYHRWGEEGRIDVATKQVRLSSVSGEAVKSVQSNLDVPGTVVVLMLPLPTSNDYA